MFEHYFNIFITTVFIENIALSVSWVCVHS